LIPSSIAFLVKSRTNSCACESSWRPFNSGVSAVNTLPLPPQLPQLLSRTQESSNSLYQQNYEPSYNSNRYSYNPQLQSVQQHQQHQQQQHHQQQHPLSNRFTQQGGSVPRTSQRRYRRQPQHKPLEPLPMGFSPPIGYSSFIQTPSAAVSVIGGVPLQMQPNPPFPSQFIQGESIYYPSTDPSLNSRDIAYSRHRRMNTHPEPVLPDLPVPPVVAPV